MKAFPYASAIESLMYAMACTRLEITYAVGVVNRFLAIAKKSTWQQ